MTQNYYLEYRLIPSLLNEVKLGRNPLQSLIDIRWFKEILTNNNIDIDWDGFSIDVYDEAYSKTSLDKGKYITYIFPPIISVPEAKYGVIDIEAMKYYTLESDYNNGYWAIGSQDVNCHALIEMVQKEMTLEDFMKSLNRPQTPPTSRKSCLSVMVLIIAIVWGIIGLYGCGTDRNDGGVCEVCPNCKSDSIKEKVVYGLLTAEEKTNPDSFYNVLKQQGKIYGGCCVGTMGHRYYCNNCGHRW